MKLENILCYKVANSVQLRISDFGFAKLLDIDNQQTGTHMQGTPYYGDPILFTRSNA